MAERSGILNLGVEGMMLVGAVSGFMVTIITGNHWIGILAAAGGGAVMAAIHAYGCWRRDPKEKTGRSRAASRICAAADATPEA
ncbi:MAG: hypothetical protein QM845_12750 [Verrucomicrobiota bacterium]|nr:hypothetical protein [Verrucomicrobiota bacterium]